MQRLEVGASELGVLARMMRKVAFFSPLTVGQLDEILPHVRIHSFSPGETVFRQGERGDAFYIVYKGSVTVRLRKLLLLSKAVAALKEGDFFGEIALISDEPRTATVVAAEPTLLFALISTDFQSVLRQNPKAAEEMKRIGDRRKFDSAHSE
ncbi:MAG: cyclic nucleotide-binding domain-containing protein [Elusimicrobia bacterium]|nr:cyclic nucleotide-binding domain-containing protein [Elusimicrobiota bacterium]